MGYNWNSAKSQFENVSEKFQKDAIDLFLTHILEMPYNIFGTMQGNLRFETIRKRLTITSIGFNRISAETQFENVLEKIQ